MLTALLLALVLAGCGERTDVAPVVTKEPLTTLRATWRKGSAVAVDRDWAYLERIGDGMRVVARDRAPWTPYRECAAPKLGAGHVATWCTNAAHPPADVQLVVDDVATPTPLGRPGTFVFATAGTRWAAVGGLPSRGPSIVWLDGREVGRWTDVSLPAFSADGARVAWIAETSPGRTALVVDGVEQATMPEPAVPTSPLVRPSKIGPNLWPQLAVRWLPHGPILLLAQDRDGWSVSRDGERLGSYRLSAWDGETATQFAFGRPFADVAAIVPTSLAVAADAPVAVWWERLGGGGERWRVVRDGVPVDDVVCATHFTAQPPQVSPDGRRVAYACPGAKGTTVVVDGRRSADFVKVAGVALSATGGHVAWSTSDAVLRDGVPLPGRWSNPSVPAIDATGAHVAWEAGRVLVLDGRPIARFDEKLWGPAFAEPGRVAWAIRRGRRVVRLTVAY